MDELTNEDVVRAIIKSLLVMPSTDVVFDTLGRSDKECIEAVSRAIDSGHVEMWECEEIGRTLTLTPYAAELAGVAISMSRPRATLCSREDEADEEEIEDAEGDSSQQPYWRRLDKPEPPNIVLHQHKSEVSYGLDYEDFEDSSIPDPLVAVMVSEDYFEAIRNGIKAGETTPLPGPFSIDVDRPPRMRVLYGQRLQWPVLNVPGQPCKACFNRPLFVGYCLICDISGIDRFLPGPEDRDRRRKRRAKSEGETNP
ncbi:hypothetical protein [Singulisphaera sp. PoT]|uniref:hypothetical protein n=1 Tax=Singulisphaera sp. PoT TaxID=3411797 RepID=UPI003BF4E2B7